jgi:hypothetical protein
MNEWMDECIPNRIDFYGWAAKQGKVRNEWKEGKEGERIHRSMPVIVALRTMMIGLLATLMYDVVAMDSPTYSPSPCSCLGDVPWCQVSCFQLVPMALLQGGIPPQSDHLLAVTAIINQATRALEPQEQHSMALFAYILPIISSYSLIIISSYYSSIYPVGQLGTCIAIYG